MNKLAIVDTGLCNLHSIARAIEECGGNPFITSDPADLAHASKVVLPGVGAFPAAMDQLRRTGLAEAMTEHVLGLHVPFLGICLGMQLMASRGFEVTETAGLGWIAGDVRRLEPAAGERVPHIGWNDVEHRDNALLFRGIEPKRDFYFVHSYVLEPSNAEDIAARTTHGGSFVSAVQRERVFGVQFHPEKSQRSGFQVLKNFLAV